MKKISFMLCFVAMVSELLADDAYVLPEGRFRFRIVSSFTELDNKYDQNGTLANFGASFSRNIDGNLINSMTQKKDLIEGIRKLNAAIPGAGTALLSENVASLNTNIDSSVFANQFVLEYGITPQLSVGIIVPLLHASVDVSASSTPDSSFQQRTQALPDADPRKAIRSAMVGSTTLPAINGLLKSQFNYSDGLQSWSGTGLGDIELGLKYNYYREHPLRMTLKSGVRMPTGREDDPNELFDLGFGDGVWAIGAYHYVDYDMLSNLYFTWEAGYTTQLPNSGSYRIPLSSDLQIGAAPIALNRKLGDYWETGLEANLTPIRRLTLSAKYRFKQKFSDSYTGDGVDTTLLEADTAQTLHEGNFQAEYTNLPDVKAGTERVPYAIVVFYRLPFTGENIADTRTTGLQIKTYF